MTVPDDRTPAILVIEDDPSVRGMLELLLQNDGYAVEGVSDGAAAISRLDGPAPDLVLLDLMMPGRHGYEILHELRERDGWGELPVVIVSALTDDLDQWRGWAAGADYFLPKPFDMDHLRAVVHRLLSAVGEGALLEELSKLAAIH